jgi:hypothetical protein
LELGCFLSDGAIVIIWIAAEVLWVPFGFVHILYFGWSAVLLILTLMSGVRRYYSINPR